MFQENHQPATIHGNHPWLSHGDLAASIRVLFLRFLQRQHHALRGAGGAGRGARGGGAGRGADAWALARGGRGDPKLNQGKTWEKSWKNIGKTWENHGKSWENHGKIMESPSNSREYMCHNM